MRIALGSVGPTLIRWAEAEAEALDAIDWVTRAIGLDAADRVGRLAAATSRPIDDHRSSAAYRRHAVGVMVRRLLMRAFSGGGS